MNRQTANSARVRWLERAYGMLRKAFLPTAPESVLLTIGFPSRQVNKTMGQCYHTLHASSGPTYITISPAFFTSALVVLTTLLHEQVHTVHPEAGHKGAFVTTCKKLGFVGKATANVAGEALAHRLNGMAVRLGPLPTAFLDPGIIKKESTRLVLLTCSCERKIRVARRTADQGGIYCGLCGDDFTPEGER